MPPKNKGTSKKPAKAMTPTLIDGLTKEEMSKEQLEEHIVRLREELDREREERNYFQLERDKIHTFWEITERQLEEAKAERKNLDKEIEDDEGRYQVEIKVYTQKMKHLLCEHQNTISELKADGLMSAGTMQKEQARLENELHKRMGSVRVDMQKLDIEKLVNELAQKHEEEMTTTRNSCEKELAEIQAKHEKKLEMQQQELDNMRKNETSDRKDFGNSHINYLIRDYEDVFSKFHALAVDMKQDLDVNVSLKEEIQDMKVKQQEIDLRGVFQSNKNLRDLLSKVKGEAEVMEKIRFSVQTKDPNEDVRIKELTDQKREYVVLEQKLGELQQERDELYKTFTQNVEKVQHNAGLKITRLEKRMKAMTDSLEKTQAQLSSVLSAPNMDQTALGGVTNRIKEEIDSSNDSIKNLQYKKAKISKACKELLLTHEAKQRAFGVPVEELCVKPVDSSLALQRLELN
ncbi:dynein regulatory complex subunit 4-like [Thunnus maccoyii]|uniref:dynein regulatory complex subunit 4-like n=1 Tax=Thunnus maccoyii TaxID=8240 RepID=UPI001C4D7E49|nr:dynein regulatory complex subunit 4-like [Thunnus maccoyii]